MKVSITRTDIWPVNDASVFTAALDIDQPTLLQISAYGPLAAPQAANTTTTSQWLYPGKDIIGGKKGGGFFRNPWTCSSSLKPTNALYANYCAFTCGDQSKCDHDVRLSN